MAFYKNNNSKGKTNSGKRPIGRSSSRSSGGRGGKRFIPRDGAPRHRMGALEGGSTRLKRAFKREVKEGVVQGTVKGYAFFIPDDKSGDWFVGEEALNGAIHGDRVACEKISDRRGSGEGRVLKVIERTKATFVATAVGSICVPLERGMPQSFSIVKSKSVPYESGERVVAKIDEGDTRFCAVTERLGKEGLTDVDILSVIRSYNLPTSFPQAVSDYAAGVPDEVKASDRKGRTDLTEECFVTIDGEHSKDFDDAICVRRLADGYALDVAIADVSHYVRQGSPLDKEALERGTSVYFADRVLPMLPEKLSNGICSLNEGVDRLVLVCRMKFDLGGNRRSASICEGIIRSKARMTYTGVAKILGGDEALGAQYAHLVPMLKHARDLAKKLEAKRAARGAVEFDLTETEFDFDADKNVVGIHPLDRLVSHKMIEEFMLIANETVAQIYCKKNAPFVYRVHENPPSEKMEMLIGFLDTLGVDFTDEPTPMDYCKLLAETDESLKGVVSRVALRSMAKADYRPECKGHFGLAATYYCHFTSPIRRYPDLAIHRIIKADIAGKSLSAYKDWVSTVSSLSSTKERVAEEAERKVDDLLKAKYMADKIGERYDGIISGVTERGIFVELSNSVEGMIHADTMAGQWRYDEQSLTVRCCGESYRLGDPIVIKVDAIHGDKISFVLAQEQDGIKD